MSAPSSEPGAADLGVPVERVVPGEGDLGCLLVHGLTGTPAEMAPVAAALASRYPLWVTRVAGHATSVDDLAATSWQDWYASATRGADALRAVTPRLAVVGLSMGALLALRLARERRAEVAGLVLLSPAVALHRRVPRSFAPPLRLLAAVDARCAPLRRVLARFRSAKGGSDIADLEVRSRHPGYRQVPLRALLNLLALQRAVLREARAITQPVLIVHAAQDHTCPLAAAEDLYARLGSRDKRLVVLRDSFHVVTVDRDRDQVLAETVAFLAQLRGG